MRGSEEWESTDYVGLRGAVNLNKKQAEQPGDDRLFCYVDVYPLLLEMTFNQAVLSLATKPGGSA